jgi:uncharacterized protein YceK
VYKLLRGAMALALCATLAGCGGARRHTAAKPPHAGAAASASPTRSHAEAFARAVNLTSADVPGFAATRRNEGESADEKRLRGSLRACVGPVRFREGLIDAQSPSFQLKRGVLDFGVSSDVSIAPTAASAAAELTTIRQERVRRCFSRYLDLLLAGQHRSAAKLSPVSIAGGTPPARGAAGSFGWRVVASFTVQSVKLSLYVDILGFVVGPARVTLVSSGLLRPFPALVQQRLFSLLLARATTNSL